MSKRFQRGDIVLEVDGIAANNKNIVQLLIGADVPGSIVSIKCQRKDEQEPFEVALKRACTTDLADKKVACRLIPVMRLSASDSPEPWLKKPSLTRTRCYHLRRRCFSYSHD